MENNSKNEQENEELIDKMSLEKQKIEIELDSKQVENIKGVCKVFRESIEEFIIKAINSELTWIESCIDYSIKDIVDHHFDFEELKVTLKQVFKTGD